jgi:hypothetical protein
LTQTSSFVWSVSDQKKKFCNIYYRSTSEKPERIRQSGADGYKTFSSSSVTAKQNKLDCSSMVVFRASLIFDTTEGALMFTERGLRHCSFLATVFQCLQINPAASCAKYLVVV